MIAKFKDGQQAIRVCFPEGDASFLDGVQLAVLGTVRFVEVGKFTLGESKSPNFVYDAVTGESVSPWPGIINRCYLVDESDEYLKLMEGVLESDKERVMDAQQKWLDIHRRKAAARISQLSSFFDGSPIDVKLKLADTIKRLKNCTGGHIDLKVPDFDGNHYKHVIIFRGNIKSAIYMNNQLLETFSTTKFDDPMFIMRLGENYGFQSWDVTMTTTNMGVYPHELS